MHRINHGGIEAGNQSRLQEIANLNSEGAVVQVPNCRTYIAAEQAAAQAVARNPKDKTAVKNLDAARTARQSLCGICATRRGCNL